jgi:transcriptional regulator with XRE-family HTH domain
MRNSRIKLSPGQVVKELRNKRGWTQAILSELTGIAVSNISNIENGRSRLGEDRAIIIATALEVKPDFILFPNRFERPDLLPRLKQIKKKLEDLKKAF